jgi:hypothetical protein
MYYMDRAIGNIPNAHNDDVPRTSWHDGQGPHKRSNDPAQSAGRHRRGKGARSNQTSHKRRRFGEQGGRGKTPSLKKETVWYWWGDMTEDDSKVTSQTVTALPLYLKGPLGQRAQELLSTNQDTLQRRVPSIKGPQDGISRRLPRSGIPHETQPRGYAETTRRNVHSTNSRA